MKHLILGSEGQIGQYVCQSIEANGDEVIRWDIKLDPKHDLRKGGSDIWPLQNACLNADFVHFLAYDVGGATYLAKKQNTFEYVKNNIAIMENVFWCLKDTGKPFYFASSQMANMTDSTYGRLKAIGESYTTALDGVNLRFWNVFGYEKDPEKFHVITSFIRQGLNEGRILCQTNGNEERHFSYGERIGEILAAIPQNYNELKRFNRNWMGCISDDSQWLTIKKVALIIADKLNVECYFGDKIDKTQSIKNEIDIYQVTNLLVNKGFNLSRNSFSYYIDVLIDQVKNESK